MCLKFILNKNASFIWSPPLYCENCKKYVMPSYGKCPICKQDLNFE